MPALSWTAYDKLTIKQGWMLRQTVVLRFLSARKCMCNCCLKSQVIRMQYKQQLQTSFLMIPGTYFDVTRHMTAVHT